MELDIKDCLCSKCGQQTFIMPSVRANSIWGYRICCPPCDWLSPECGSAENAKRIAYDNGYLLEPENNTGDKKEGAIYATF